MTPKFSSKEIHFLKTNSDDFNIKAPETYFCDILLNKTAPLKLFRKRLSETKIPGGKFLCAVVQIPSDTSDIVQEKTKDIFTTRFNSFVNHKKGIWENLNPNSFVLAFWGYDDDKKASQLIETFKNKLSMALKSEILMGVAAFPFHKFSKSQTLSNALKAIDHAAFFGPDTLIHFDAISLNISGDRLYQLDKSEAAIKDYQKGLEIEPQNINLINSLGVCFGVTGKLDVAKLEFEKAMKVNPKELIVIYNIGLLYQIEGDIDNAIRYLQKAHDIEPSVFEVELLLGHLLIKKGQPDLAIFHLENASRTNPESGLVFRMKGEIYLEKNLFKKAGKEFNKAIKLNPCDAVSLSGYAQSLALQDRNLTIALTLAKQSIILEPDNKQFKKRLKAILDKMEDSPIPAKT
ncbi:tetratricopeptide repeat protein [Desulfobacula sp.]